MRRAVWRAGRVALVVALLVGLVPAAISFVAATTPSRDAEQHRPPQVAVPADAAAAAAALPEYTDAVPVLTFHDVAPEASSPYTLTPVRFAEHVAALAQAGFQSVSLRQVEELVAGRRPALPPRPILITFDDGAIGNWTWADPILAQHGFTAVAFVVTSQVGHDAGPSSYYLDWASLARMAGTGRWEVGGHTHNGHRTIFSGEGMAPWLTNLAVDDEGRREELAAWETRVREDLATNRSRIEEELGLEVRSMAYPFSASAYPTNDGRIPARVRTLVADRFDLAFTNLSTPRAVVPGEDPAALPRLSSVTADMATADVLGMIARSVPQPPPADPTTLSWVAAGTGACTATGGSVDVRGSSYTTCRPEVAHPDRWTDYVLTTEVVGTDAGATALVAVRAGPSERAEVAVGPVTAVVRQQVHGEWRSPHVIELPPLEAGQARPVSVAVQGGDLTVRVGGATHTTALAPAVAEGVISLGLVPRGGDHVLFTSVALRSG